MLQYFQQMLLRPLLATIRQGQNLVVLEAHKLQRVRTVTVGLWSCLSPRCFVPEKLELILAMWEIFSRCHTINLQSPESNSGLQIQVETH